MDAFDVRQEIVSVQARSFGHKVRWSKDECDDTDCIIGQCDHCFKFIWCSNNCATNTRRVWEKPCG